MRTRHFSAAGMLLVAIGLTASAAALAPVHAAQQPSVYHGHADGHAHADGAGVFAAGPLPYPARGGWDTTQHDGVALATDAPDLTTLPTIHAIYLYPSNAPNRFAQLAAKFQHDARRASSFLHSLTGRSLRFDERADSRAAYATPIHDVSVLKSKYNDKKLGGSTQFNLVRDEITARGFNKPNKKYLVWVDAGSSWCGQSQMPADPQRSPANKAEGTTVSTVYRYNDPASAEGGFCSGVVVLHELTHALGAVQTTAPNWAGGHCDDWGNDVMCTASTAPPYDPALGMHYDYGNDDYWDPAADPNSGSTAKLGWWTTNLSRFVCPTAGCEYPNANPGY